MTGQRCHCGGEIVVEGKGPEGYVGKCSVCGSVVDVVDENRPA